MDGNAVPGTTYPPALSRHFYHEILESDLLQEEMVTHNSTLNYTGLNPTSNDTEPPKLYSRMQTVYENDSRSDISETLAESTDEQSNEELTYYNMNN